MKLRIIVAAALLGLTTYIFGNEPLKQEKFLFNYFNGVSTGAVYDDSTEISHISLSKTHSLGEGTLVGRLDGVDGVSGGYFWKEQGIEGNSDGLLSYKRTLEDVVFGVNSDLELGASYFNQVFGFDVYGKTETDLDEHSLVTMVNKEMFGVNVFSMNMFGPEKPSHTIGLSYVLDDKVLFLTTDLKGNHAVTAVFEF